MINKESYYSQLDYLLERNNFLLNKNLLGRQNSIHGRFADATGALVGAATGGVDGFIFSKVLTQVLKTFSTSGSVDSLDLDANLGPIENWYHTLAVKYHKWTGDLQIVAVIDADDLSLLQLVERSHQLGDRLLVALKDRSLLKKVSGRADIFVTCIYVFFDHKYCSKISRKLRKKAKHLSWALMMGVIVRPVIINVPKKKVETNINKLQLVIGKRELKKAF